MSEQPNETYQPDAASPGPDRSENLFTIQKKFPAQGAEPPPAPAAKRPLPRLKKGNRLLLPMVLFVGIVGALAWIVQYLPNWRKKNPLPPTASKQVFQFPETQAHWDPADDKYAMEYEHGEPGHYDFPFHNLTADAAELGLGKTSCDCTTVQVARLSSSQWATWEKTKNERTGAGRPQDSASKDWPWISLGVDEKTGIVVPGNAKGLVRVTWKGRRGEGENLRLRISLWMQPQGKPRDREFVDLETPTVIVSPLMFTQTKVSLGTLAPGAIAETEFLCWSSTRPKMNLDVVNDSPLMVWKVVPMKPEECRLLEQILHDKEKGKGNPLGAPVEVGANTRVRLAYRIRVKVYEQKEGKQLDQGPFQTFAPLRMDGEAFPGAVPLVYGKVQGEVEVGGSNDQGKISLGNFQAQAGTQRHILLWTSRSTSLKLEKTYPGLLEVKLTENPKESTPQKRNWLLEVKFPAGSPAGPLPEDSSVILRTHSTQPRYIRIPIVGTAVQG